MRNTLSGEGVHAIGHEHPPRPMRRTFALPPALAALTLLAALAACNKSTGLDDISVTVQGTVVDQQQTAVEGVWVHLVAGAPQSPTPVTADQTDASGAYAISTLVPPEDCNDLRLAVLDTQSFDASATPLASSLLGSCGDLHVDLTTSGQP